jgi:hypothetical protein
MLDLLVLDLSGRRPDAPDSTRLRAAERNLCHDPPVKKIARLGRQAVKTAMPHSTMHQ